MSLRAGHLRTNARVRPLGMDSRRPEFAWKLQTEASEVIQTAYEIELAASEDFDSPPLWGSGRVPSDLPFGAVYGGPELESMTRYWWRVRVAWSGNGRAQPVSQWSDPDWFETGILDPVLWSAEWISGPAPSSKKDDPVLYLRGAVELSTEVVRARAYASALGWYRLFVNGHDITGDDQVPRFTPLSEVVEYQTYDVTDALRAGRNILAVAVGDGRYRGGLGLTGSRAVYGDRIGAFAQFEITLADGTTVRTQTDGAWFAGPGRITGSDPKNGERADLRIPDSDWLTGAEVPARFARAEVLPDDGHALIAEEVDRVRGVERLCATVSRAPSGAQLLDFGQNFSGVVRMRLRGPSGTVVQLTHGELLTPAGELDVKSFTDGFQFFQRDVVTLSSKPEWWQPSFTTHGFRYVEVTGLSDTIDPADVEGVVVSTDFAHTGTFESSDPRLNQLHHNVVWSVISNFTDTPTDCPTRERAGWTGDIQAFSPTAAVLVDSQAFLHRYLRNLAIEQFDDGFVPIYVPSQAPIKKSVGRTMVHYMSGAVGWSDAAVILPWTLYTYYGDLQLLARQYDSMRMRVDGMARRAAKKRRGGRYILNSGFHFGEWLRPGDNALKTIAGHMVRSPAEIATAYFAHSAAILAQAADVLGRRVDAERYRTLSAKVAAAWRDAYVHADGTVALDRQDDYVRALAFDLVRPEQRQRTVERLVELIRENGNHITTGFLSTPMLLQVLVDGGRSDVALDLLFQNTSPSWLYQVERGATTVWETWEGYKDDGYGKASHNHYAFGAVARWLTEGLAGLSPAAPGYREILIAPVLAPQLQSAGTTVDTPFGEATSRWQREGDTLVLEVTVPAGTTARIMTPWETRAVGSGNHILKGQDMAAIASA
ncbi:alpha-L-rhamnosidase [Microbacterium sp. cf046]|nr:alpha-L-rhamnosidase [Microbacterium sp. cf046]